MTAPNSKCASRN